MANELAHISLANKNHDALSALMNCGGHSEWLATIAFYKALQIVEAVFAINGYHGYGHQKRLAVLQDSKRGFGSFCSHYEALLEASEIARYLGSRNSSRGYTTFDSYMTRDDVIDDLLKKRLMNVEMHARGLLSDEAKKELKLIQEIV